jgi:RimJ/RimL family protein N-acetyltransferase
MKDVLVANGICKTERLQIAVLKEQRAGLIFDITNDPKIAGVVQYLPNPFSVEDACMLVSQQVENEECYLGGWEQNGGPLIGVFGVHARDQNELEISYWISSKHQCRGYATELARGAIAQIGKCLPKMSIVAECRQANVQSWRVLEKLGFQSSGLSGRRPGRTLLFLRREVL